MLRKIAYPSKTAALAALPDARKAATKGRRLNTYRCPFCNLWHVGHVGRRGASAW